MRQLAILRHSNTLSYSIVLTFVYNVFPHCDTTNMAPVYILYAYRHDRWTILCDERSSKPKKTKDRSKRDERIYNNAVQKWDFVRVKYITWFLQAQTIPPYLLANTLTWPCAMKSFMCLCISNCTCFLYMFNLTLTFVQDLLKVKLTIYFYRCVSFVKTLG